MQHSFFCLAGFCKAAGARGRFLLKDVATERQAPRMYLFGSCFLAGIQMHTSYRAMETPFAAIDALLRFEPFCVPAVPHAAGYTYRPGAFPMMRYMSCTEPCATPDIKCSVLSSG